MGGWGGCVSTVPWPAFVSLAATLVSVNARVLRPPCRPVSLDLVPPTPSPRLNPSQFDAAVEAAEKHVVEFGEHRDRVLGDYYRELTHEERLAAVNDALPKGSKRMGLKPEDVGSALLAHMHEAVSAPGGPSAPRP